jgi:hypothetical protein
MNRDPWTLALACALATNAVLGFAYRVFRLMRGGPPGDVIGQAILGLLLGVLALFVAAGAGWSRWVALAYGLTFAVIVMPVWTVAVLIPMRPGRVDVGFALLYWAMLAVTVIAALVV